MAKVKTREEKIKSSYRLANFKITEGAKREEKDIAEFAYLDASFVKKDLFKTIVVSIIMVGIIVAAKKYLG
ncbi:MAG: hypothetical protein WCL07_03750 [bacterium]